MKIGIKKLKVCQWMSEETTCFDCIVTLDGVACIEASNEGHGGSTFLRDLPNHHGSVARLTAYAKTLPPIVCPDMRDPNDPLRPFSYPQSADGLVDELVYDAEGLKQMRKALKKRATFKTGKTLRHYAGITWETLCSRHAVLFEKVKAQFPDAVWLNPLPEAEAFALWKEATR
jgi:hypothetical protein